MLNLYQVILTDNSLLKKSLYISFVNHKLDYDSILIKRNI